MSAVRNTKHVGTSEHESTLRSIALSPANQSDRQSHDACVTYRRGVGLVVRDATLDAPEVEAEALRWTTGSRGEPVDAEKADGADLSEYHRVAVCLGARVLQASADSATAVTLAGTVAQLAERAEAAGANLVEGALRASTQVVEVAAKASKEATEATGKIIETARERFQKEVGTSVAATMQSVQRELDRLFGAEDSAAVLAIKDVIGRAMTDAQVAWHGSLTTTLTELGKAIDVNNPTSPLGALERRMIEQQQRQHAELTSKLDHVQELVGIASSAASTAAAVAAAHAASPAKGRPFQAAVGMALETVAAGMAASYTDTADTVGNLKACKKGDGVIEAAPAAPGGPRPRVLVELTTQGHPRHWQQYLEVAERNRGAHASLGVVPTRDLVPGGDVLAVVGQSRIVLAFDPEQDDPGLLRAAVQLLVVQAQRKLAEDRAGDLGIVDSRLDEACRRLVEMSAIIKTAATARDAAGKVVSGLEGLHASLALCLDQARSALAPRSIVGSSAA